MNAAARAPRLVLLDLRAPGATAPRLLLIKGGAGTGIKIANMPGYHFWGGRWHKTSHDKPAPKGAPVAVHPHSGGQHAPVKHFTDDQWSQLKLPDDNVNAASHNKKLDQIKELSEGGHVTGLLGLGLGVNTYGKKQAAVINHLLGLHGSPHKVEAGQKPGEHAAVQQSPAEPHPSGPPEHLAPKTRAKFSAGALVKVSDDLTTEDAGKTGTVVEAKDYGAGDFHFKVQFDDGHKEWFQPGEIDAHEPEPVGPSIADLQASGHLPAAGGKPTFPAGNPWADVVDGAEKAHASGNWQDLADFEAEAKSSPTAWGKQALAYIHGLMKDGPDPDKKAGPLQMPDFEEGKTVSGVKAHYEKVAQQIIDHGHAGNASVLDDMKAAGTKPGASGKAANSWAGKTANSKKLLALHAQALDYASGKTKPAEPAAAPEPVPGDYYHVNGVTGGLGNEGPPKHLLEDDVDFDKVSDLLGLPSGALSDESSTTYTVALKGGQAFSVYKHKGALSVRASGPKSETGAVDTLLGFLKKHAGPKEGDTKPAADGGTLVLKDGHWVKQGGDVPEIKTDASGKPVKPALTGFADVADNIQGYIDSGDQANLSDAITNLTGLKSANAQAALAYAKAGVRYLQSRAAKSADGNMTFEPVKPAASGSLSADKLGKLQSIPWFKLKLPDSNTNAKSHNAAVSKIEAMAFAGDVAGLQAFVDSKKDAKQTYAKKQGLLAQTAIAALQDSGSGAPAPAKAPVTADTPLTASQKQALESLSPAELGALHGGPGLPPNVAAYIAQKVAAAAAPAPAKTAKVSATLLHHTTDGHNKFWAASLSPDGLSMMTTYGKIASKGQQTVKKYATQAHAVDAINKLIDEKKDKGYKYVGQTAHEHATSAAPQPAKKLTAANIKELYKLHGNGAVGFATQTPIGALAQKSALAGDAPGIIEAHEKAAAKGWDSVASMIVHVASAMGVAIPGADTGPKEGDTKQGADGLLVLKDGHWVKVNKDGNAWGFDPADLALSGAPSLTIEADDGAAYYVAYADGEFEVGKHSFDPDSESKFAQFTDAAEALAHIDTITGGKVPLPSAAALSKLMGNGSPAATPAPAAGGMPSMDAWIQTGGQGGSNPGGKFSDPSGQDWYCKFPADEDTAKSEVLAAKLYALAGIAGQDAQLVTKGGKIGIASKWTDVKKAASPGKLAAVDGAQSGFAVDAWLANWDVVGLNYDNLQVGPDGKAIRIDAGGSLEYRAQGAKKPFGATVGEIETLRDAKLNPQAAAIFGKMTKADITASVAKVAAVSDDDIRDAVMQHGPGDEAAKKALADTLIARKKDLLAKFPGAAKAIQKRLNPSKLPVNPSTLPKPHDFANWNGPGKGLSSKDHINEANLNVEHQMLAVAKQGNLKKLQGFEYQDLDKETGIPSGKHHPIASHPSKHVVQYHSDLAQILDEIANPPKPLKVFRETDVGTLAALTKAFPPQPFGTTVAKVSSNQKLGFWVALGTVSSAKKFAPKKTSNFSTAMVAEAKAKYVSAPKLAKHFIKSVQASGSYNDLFRDGKVTDHSGNELKDVALAALAHATERPEGTSVYRWQKISPQMLEHIMAAKDGTVFQATGPMCTSYSETATKGFGAHRIVIRYAKGAKAVESFASGGFASEKEVTTLPNARFVILSKKMVPDIEHNNPTGQRLELEVLMLPPDLGL